MRFSILQMILATCFVAIAIVLSQIPESGFIICITFVMPAIAFLLSRFQATSDCRRFLFLRWHIAPLGLAFWVSIAGNSFSLGPWGPPLSWIVTALAAMAIVATQFRKTLYPNQPNTELRLTQIVLSWAIVFLNTAALSYGNSFFPP